jgi:uncharacterized protein YndB with AHSA1/START domain
MNRQATDLTVRRSVTVARNREDAFRVFTEEIGSWWPLETHSIGKDGRPAETAAIDGREGGSFYERTGSGTEHWGTILVWEPPARIVISWELRPERPPTEIEVLFTEEGEGTRVVLEHRGFERLGDEAEDVAAGYSEGWTKVLGQYAELANAST